MNSPPRRLRRTLPLEEVHTFAQLRAYCRIPDNGWEAIIVGDGSATQWHKPAGWGSVLIQRYVAQRQLFWGGLSHGTNNVAELMALLHPLLYLANSDEADTVREGGYRVHLLSDSEYVINNLPRITEAAWASSLSKNRELWLALHGCCRRGFVLQGHHLPRDRIDLQQLCHRLANTARRGAQASGQGEWDPAAANPEE